MEEEDFDDVPVEALQGNAQPAGDTSELGTVILMLTGELTKLEILLGEVDEDEMKKLAPRLKRLLGVLTKLPTPIPRRPVGFQGSKSRRRSQSASQKRKR